MSKYRPGALDFGIFTSANSKCLGESAPMDRFASAFAARIHRLWM